MATVTHRSTIAATTNNAAVVSGSFTPVVNDLLVAISYHTGKAVAPAVTASANGITFTPVFSVLKAASADVMTFWVATQLVPTSPVAMTVTSTPGTASGGAISVFSVGAVTRTGLSAIRGTGSQANQASGTPAAAMSATTLAGNPIIAAVFNGANPAAMTQPSGYSEAADTGYATPTSGVEAVFLQNPGAGISTLTWGSSSASAFCSGVVEIDASVLITGAASLSASTDCVATGLQIAPAGSSLSALSDFAASPLLMARGGASLDALSDLVGVGLVVIPGAADLGGVGNLVGVAIVAIQGAASLSATTTAAATALQLAQASAELSGLGNLVAVADVFSGGATITGSADLEALGGLTASSLIVAISAGALASIADLAATATLEVVGHADLASDSVFLAGVTLIRVGSADLVVASEFVVAGSALILGLADLQALVGLDWGEVYVLPTGVPVVRKPGLVVSSGSRTAYIGRRPG